MATIIPKRSVFVVGIGMTKFVKPNSSGNDYPDFVKEAVLKSLDDCKLQYQDIEQAVVAYVFGESCSGQRCLYELGMTGIPIYNVNNSCASGSTGILVLKQFIESGSTDVGLCVGFEKMLPGSLGNMVIQFTARLGMYFRHAQFQKEFSLEEIKNSKMISDPLTMLQCSATSDGAAAVILCSEQFLDSHSYLRKQAVEILGMQLGTDFPCTFEENSALEVAGFSMMKNTAKKLYEETGLGPNDVQVIELHDGFSTMELLSYEALGLCPDGVAQCVELSLQLRGEAGERQVTDARIALQHNVGIGGACVVAMYKLACPKKEY